MKKTADEMEMTILAKLDLGDWQQLFSDRIYERGLAYYEDEAVHSIKRTGNKITAAVDGSDTYTVTLYVKEDAVYNYDLYLSVCCERRTLQAYGSGIIDFGR